MHSLNNQVSAPELVKSQSQFQFDGLLKAIISRYKSTHQSFLLFQIYELTYSHVYDFIFELTGSEQQAVYFVQKTFQNFSKKIKTYDDKQSLVNWFNERTTQEMIARGYQMQLFPYQNMHQAI